MGCADHDDYEESPCPLPITFNHNALFHVLLIVDAVLFFIAEYTLIRRRAMRECVSEEVINSRKEQV